MRYLLFLSILLAVTPTHAASQCEIEGEAIFCAYDSCMWRYETDDSLNPGVMACADSAQLLIKKEGDCIAKRILKERICQISQKTEGRHRSVQHCMRDPEMVGSTVRDGGI